MAIGQMVGIASGAALVIEAQAQAAAASASASQAAASAYESARTAAGSPVAQVSVVGANLARAICLRSILHNRMTAGGVAVVHAGTNYSSIGVVLRDYRMAALGFPGYFTASVIRPVVDLLVSGIGGNGTYPTAAPDSCNAAGTYGYSVPGFPPAFDSGPYLAMLAALCADRGDSTVYATHRADLETGLGYAPRGVSGCIYSAAENYDWGFQDLANGMTGDYGMATALHAQAYRALATVASREGDSANAAIYTAAATALLDGLSTLRRADGLYNASSVETKPHAILTALVVAEGLCTAGERTASAAALLAAYRAGLITERGGVRHLVYPDVWSASVWNGGVSPYQNGGFWVGEWTGWLIKALALVDQGAARQLGQEAVDEIQRFQRVGGVGPYEWSAASTGQVGSSKYSAVAAFLPAVAEAEQAVSLTLSGATSSSAMVEVPHGHSVSRIQVYTSASSTLTVSVTAAHRTAAVGDSAVDPPYTFGTETSLGVVSLSAATVGELRAGMTTARVFGGYIRATIVSGSSTAPVIVRCVMTPVVPTLGADTSSTDDFSTNTIGNYTVNGTFAVSAGVLNNTTAGDGQYAVLTAATYIDGTASADITCAGLTTRFPGVVCRFVDANNWIAATISGSLLTVAQKVGGVYSSRGTYATTLNNGQSYNLRLVVFGDSCLAYLDGVLRVACTTTLLSYPGKMGAYLGSTGTAACTWDNLTISRSPQLVQPWNVIENGGTSGYLAGESYLQIVSGTTNLRGPDGGVMLTTAALPPVLTY